MLSKASERGLDWESFLPLAMQCLRVCPNRDTGFSPSELVFGRNIRTPLDILYCVWVENEVEGVEVEVWVEGLKEWLGVL